MMFFTRQFLKSPFTVGSVCPSSRILAHVLAQMAINCPPATPGLIIDLGAGTGVISRELLALGVAPEGILPIDVSTEFKSIFDRLCSPLTLCIADAAHLYAFLSKYYSGMAVLAIISSLPLRIMAKKEVLKILQEIGGVLLERGGFLLQYTYAFWRRASLAQYGFSLTSTRYVVRNIPPTLVEKYALATRR